MGTDPGLDPSFEWVVFNGALYFRASTPEEPYEPCRCGLTGASEMVRAMTAGYPMLHCRTFIASLLLVGACSPSTTGRGSSTGGSTGGAQECEQPPSQPLSSQCCPSLGVDACGAGLFCAAFDGRTVPTCYAERSRADGATCTEDRQCQSGGCNTASGVCKSTVGTICTVEIGCGPSPGGERVVCAETAGTERRCSISGGAEGEACMADADCVSGRCINEQCACAPQCSGKDCGDDGCGGSCGSCGELGSCSSGHCGCLNPDVYVFCDGACTNTYGDDNNCGGCGFTCTSEDTCMGSETRGHPVCRSQNYYAPEGSETLLDCEAVCQRQGYPRCRELTGGGCETASTHGCYCERDPE